MAATGMLRGTIVTLAMVVALASGTSMLAGFLSPNRVPLDSNNWNSVSPAEQPAPGWLTQLVLFRIDLQSNSALALARQAAKSAPSQTIETRRTAEATLQSVLSASPSNSDLWLMLAVLVIGRDSAMPQIAEALKMSYFTAPNDVRIVRLRLSMAVQANVIADPDLKELASGDLRPLLTRNAEICLAVVDAYRQASATGRAFLEGQIRSISPDFLPVLRGEKTL